MKNFDLENVDCHATLAMIEKRWGFPRRTLRALLGMTENAQSGRSLLEESGADAPQSGRSMIEMLGVLAIIGVLSVGGIAGYSKAMQKYRINKTIEQITLIAGNIRAFFASQQDFSGLSGCGLTGTASGGNIGYTDCRVVKKAKIVPDEMLTISNNLITGITNAFGGRFMIGTGVYNNSTASIMLEDIPEEACIELLSQDWSAINLYRICFPIGPEDQFYAGGCVETKHFDIDAAVSKCSSSYRNEYSKGKLLFMIKK